MTFSWKLSSFYSPKKKPSGVFTAGKPVIGSQSYSREIQTVVQYKKYYMHLMILWNSAQTSKEIRKYFTIVNIFVYYAK